MINGLGKMFLSWLLIIFCLVSVSFTRNEKPEKKQNWKIKVHRYSSPESGIFANAYCIELADSVVVVDATLINSTSLALKSKIDSLGKPIAAVLITHGHPDHYNGLGNLVSEDKRIPVYSTQGVLDVIKESDKSKEEQWTPMFGDEWPRNRVFPNRVLDDKASITVGGAEFSVHNLGPGESHSDTYWIMNDGDQQVAFIGDAVLHGVHAYLSDGHVNEWLGNLATLERALRDVSTIYPGHGEPGSLEILNWQRNYINTYLSSVKELLGKKEKLDEADKVKLIAAMKAFLPNNKLEFLIVLGSDVVSAQLRN